MTNDLFLNGFNILQNTDILSEFPEYVMSNQLKLGSLICATIFREQYNWIMLMQSYMMYPMLSMMPQMQDEDPASFVKRHTAKK